VDKFKFEIDSTPPGVWLQPAKVSWKGPPQIVRLSVSDSGGGVATTTVNGIPTAALFVVDHAGTYEIVATDKLGNATTRIFTVADEKPPTAPNIAPDVTAWTRKPVVLVASGSADESGIADYQYSVGGGAWTTGHVVTVTSNVQVRFRAVDNVGNYSAASAYSVGNIDTVAPVVPSANLWSLPWLAAPRRGNRSSRRWRHSGVEQPTILVVLLVSR